MGKISKEEKYSSCPEHKKWHKCERGKEHPSEYKQRKAGENPASGSYQDAGAGRYPETNKGSKEQGNEKAAKSKFGWHDKLGEKYDEGFAEQYSGMDSEKGVPEF